MNHIIPSSLDDTGPAARATLRKLMERLLHDVSILREQALDPLPQGQRRRWVGASKRWLLGLELIWKVEEQVLLPALHDASSAGESAAVRQAHEEIEILRDLAQLAQNTTPTRRAPVLHILQGMADLHIKRVATMLEKPAATAVPWARLRRELRQLFDRWRREVMRTGDIEDEERDPVGLPPR